jgi:hypothetical protein
MAVRSGLAHCRVQPPDAENRMSGGVGGSRRAIAVSRPDLGPSGRVTGAKHIPGFYPVEPGLHRSRIFQEAFDLSTLENGTQYCGWAYRKTTLPGPEKRIAESRSLYCATGTGS